MPGLCHQRARGDRKLRPLDRVLAAMSTADRAEIEHLEAEAGRLRAAYLDLMRDSLIGRLNEDPALPASKVEGYKYDHRESGWDWPSQAPSMIGAKRMDNVRSECERVLQAGVPGDFMETGVWRGGACIMMRAVLRAYGVVDRRVIAADSFAGFPPPSPGRCRQTRRSTSTPTAISPFRSMR